MFPRRTPGWVEITYVYIATNSTHLYFQWSIPGLPTAALHTWGDFAESRPARIRYEKVLIPACVPPTPAPITISGKKINKKCRCHRSSGGPFQMPSWTSEPLISCSNLPDAECEHEATCGNLNLGWKPKKKKIALTHFNIYLCIYTVLSMHSEYSLKKKTVMDSLRESKLKPSQCEMFERSIHF